MSEILIRPPGVPCAAVSLTYQATKSVDLAKEMEGMKAITFLVIKRGTTPNYDILWGNSRIPEIQLCRLAPCDTITHTHTQVVAQNPNSRSSPFFEQYNTM